MARTVTALLASCMLLLLLLSSTLARPSSSSSSSSSSPTSSPAPLLLTPYDEFLIGCAQGNSSCDAFMNITPDKVPATFTTTILLASGAFFNIHVVTAWAPVMATRFYILSMLMYFDGAPFYRVLRLDNGTSFVSQFGYRNVPAVDAAWIASQTSTATAPVLAPGGNKRGTVAFGTGEIARNGSTPNCTADECSYGFNVELFINTQDNSAKLDAMDFTPFGYIEEEEMQEAIDGACVFVM